MTIRLANNILTRYVTRAGYAAAENVPLEGAVAEVATSLIAWLGLQLATGESVNQVFLEPDGHVSEMDEEGNSVATRNKLSAAVTVTHPLGSRTFTMSSEQLPAELRAGLLAAWEALQNV